MERFYKCALALFGVFILFNLSGALDNAVSSLAGLLLLLTFVGSIFFVFQKNRGCQLAGWMCCSYFSVPLLLMSIQSLRENLFQLRIHERAQQAQWSKYTQYGIDHYRGHSILDAVIVLMLSLLAISAVWLLVRRLKELIREDDLRHGVSNKELDEIRSAPMLKVQKGKAPEEKGSGTTK